MTPTLRKAAILIAALDRKNADRLLNQLSPREAQTLRQAVLRLDSVAADEQADVIEEFFEIGPWTQAAPLATETGVELDPLLAARLAANSTLPGDADWQPPRPNRRVAVGSKLRCLQDIDSETLAPLLHKEHPQTIAVVISHLAHHQAARVLSTLPADVQPEVLRRVSDLEEMDPEILRELEHALESWVTRHVSPTPQRARAAGLAAISDILRAADAGAQASPLTDLHGRDRHLAGNLAAAAPAPPAPSSPLLSFEQLAQLEDEALRTLLREAEPDLVMLALTGASKRILDRVLSLFPPRDAEVLRRELAHLGPMRLSDVEAARHELAVVASRLADDKRIELRRKRLSVAA